ncbi:polysaccharide deacetylase family protein [Caballeronia sp. LjRoot29]|uniref:polysaccharide deacetylase family protein n=1 Tax=Caballeronia sp. LjRoot29 TaxID=3342315 RepID=UPI003ED0AF4B
MNRALSFRLLRMLAFAWLVVTSSVHASASEAHVVILVYHRFALTAQDSMTVRTDTFEAQLQSLRTHGYQVVPLRDVIKWLNDPTATLPPKTAVLTVDDGHRSVFDILRPIAIRDRLPVTLFVYPSAISNASYALTWDQLRTLKQTGLFDVQSHTYWHPNFKIERKRLSPAEFIQFVRAQLQRSRTRIEAEVGGHVDMLAWPFGIYDAPLMALAASEGYVAAFTLDGHAVKRQSAMLALPRFLIIDAYNASAFARLLGETEGRSVTASESRP